MTEEMTDGQGVGAKLPGAPGLGGMFRSAMKDAREKLSEAVGEDTVTSATEAARKGLGTAGRAYGKAEDAVSQAAAWAEVRATLDDLVDVARTQHAMILDLLDRVAALEAPAAPTFAGTGTGTEAADMVLG